MMAKPFTGTINVDIRDSEPDWTPFEPPVAPYGAPNVVYIVLDDVGFSALNCYGGPIETPNKVGEGRIKTQPGKFAIGGEGLCVGRDSGEAVTDDYPGTAPWRFTGGTICQVQVNVSGRPYVDLEREAVAMMSRE
jgi:hypothetical protein